MKGCVFNKLTIYCLLVVLGGLVIMIKGLIQKLCEPMFPESERYGTYFNPNANIYMKFCDDDKSNDYRYVLFSRSIDSLNYSTADYIKISKCIETSFAVYFLTDSTGKVNILCPSDEFYGSNIIAINSNKFPIDTIARFRSNRFQFIDDGNHNSWMVDSGNYSEMNCSEGFVNLSINGSMSTPLCSIRDYQHIRPE